MTDEPWLASVRLLVEWGEEITLPPMAQLELVASIGVVEWGERSRGNGYACFPGHPRGIAYRHFHVPTPRIAELEQRVRDTGLPDRDPDVQWDNDITAPRWHTLRLTVTKMILQGEERERTIRLHWVEPVRHRGRDVAAVGRLLHAVLDMAQLGDAPVAHSVARMMAHTGQ